MRRRRNKKKRYAISKNNNYVRGRGWEYTSMYNFRDKNGKYSAGVKRSYGSKGPSDWWGAKAVVITPEMVGQTFTLLVLAQCKKHDGLLKPEEVGFMWEEAEKTGGNSYHVFVRNRRTVYEPVYLNNSVPI